jgi:glycosyltransferase involved in cell wall biosynthesis
VATNNDTLGGAASPSLERPLLSVIIPCYNAAGTLGAQLEAIAAQEWAHPWEVIIADNGSRDGSQQVAESYCGRVPGLRVVDASARKGGAFARNEAARAARGRSLAFVDADDVVAPGWLAAIGTALATRPFVASRFDTERLNRQSWVGRVGGNYQADGLQRIAYPPYLLHAGGCGIGVWRELHERVGGFDEGLLRLMDTDYCFRIQLQCAVELAFVPEATVYVRSRDTLGGMFRQIRERALYNTYLAERYRPKGQQRKVLRAWYSFGRRWLRLWLRLGRVRSREQFADWLRVLGWLVGLLQGSIKYRVPPL